MANWRDDDQMLYVYPIVHSDAHLAYCTSGPCQENYQLVSISSSKIQILSRLCFHYYHVPAIICSMVLLLSYFKKCSKFFISIHFGKFIVYLSVLQSPKASLVGCCGCIRPTWCQQLHKRWQTVSLGICPAWSCWDYLSAQHRVSSFQTDHCVRLRAVCICFCAHFSKQIYFWYKVSNWL